MKKEVYDIGGMHCAACSSAVERVTGKLPGVKRSEVNLPLNRLTIEYDEKKTDSVEIVERVEKAGFTAELHGGKKKAEREKERSEGAAELIVMVCCAGLLLVLSMGQMLLPGMPVPDVISMETHPVNLALTELLLAIPVLVLGRGFFIGGFKALFHLNPNMDSLVALSATAALIYSIVMTYRITDDPDSVHQLYYESAAVVVALVSVGKRLEANSKEKTKDAIKGLMRLTPETAVVVEEAGERELPVSEVRPGDTVLVRAGERIPVDGEVKSGSGSADESMLTGESMPIEKGAGSAVTGGSMLNDGALYITVTRTGDDTTLSRIIAFVEDAQGKKAPISKTADRVAGVFVPIVMGIALVSAAVWLIAGEDMGFALKIFTTVLVIACPCAMGLATPTAIIVGTGMGANRGILIRSGEALELCSRARTVIFDKTGTLTEGTPRVTDTAARDEAALYTAANALERLSAHPIARAVCDEARARGCDTLEAEELINLPGRGLSGVIEGETVLAGSARLLTERGVDTSQYTDDAGRFESEGKTVVFVSRAEKCLGVIAVSDGIKPDAKETVHELKQSGIRTVLLTGDNLAAAEYIGKQAGVDAVEANVLPTDKARIVEKYQNEGHAVLMVGDGINDAPALAQADVGCAVGSGSDIAIDSADIVLMKPELFDVCRAVKLSRYTVRNIKQNLFWAFCYNVLLIPVAAGALYPAFHLLLSPMIGGLAMSLSSLFVVTNALRLRRKKL